MERVLRMDGWRVQADQRCTAVNRRLENQLVGSTETDQKHIEFTFSVMVWWPKTLISCRYVGGDPLTPGHQQWKPAQACRIVPWQEHLVTIAMLRPYDVNTVLSRCLS